MFHGTEYDWLHQVSAVPTALFIFLIYLSGSNQLVPGRVLWVDLRQPFPPLPIDVLY